LHGVAEDSDERAKLTRHCSRQSRDFVIEWMPLRGWFGSRQLEGRRDQIRQFCVSIIAKATQWCAAENAREPERQLHADTNSAFAQAADMRRRDMEGSCQFSRRLHFGQREFQRLDNVTHGAAPPYTDRFVYG
jgi:hypothetical protein